MSVVTCLARRLPVAPMAASMCPTARSARAGGQQCLFNRLIALVQVQMFQPCQLVADGGNGAARA